MTRSLTVRPRMAVSEAALGDLLKTRKENIMSDTSDFMASYEHHQKRLAEANVLNKNLVFEALTAAAITIVNVMFDGEGDSGQIGEITAGNAEIPQLSIDLKQAAWGTDTLTNRTTTLREAIETLCYDYLSQEHDGWENDDGGYGEFTFRVAERQLELDFNARYSDSVSYSHSF
jgi:hypothetical protein